jgi:hypothetical protein
VVSGQGLVAVAKTHTRWAAGCSLIHTTCCRLASAVVDRAEKRAVAGGRQSHTLVTDGAEKARWTGETDFGMGVLGLGRRDCWTMESHFESGRGL